MRLLGALFDRGQLDRLDGLRQLYASAARHQRQGARRLPTRRIAFGRDKFQHGVGLKRINPGVAQQAHRVEIRGRGQAVLLRQPPRHAQLPPRQPFLPDRVDLLRGRVVIAGSVGGDRRLRCGFICAARGGKGHPGKAVIIRRRHESVIADLPGAGRAGRRSGRIARRRRIFHRIGPPGAEPLYLKLHSHKAASLLPGFRTCRVGHSATRRQSGRIFPTSRPDATPPPWSRFAAAAARSCPLYG